MVERARIRLFAGMAICGLLMIGLSFLPWIRFHSLTFEGDTSPQASVSFTGAHISRWRDAESLGRNDVKNIDGWCSCDVSLGDGYLTAVLGLAVVVVALAGWFTGRDRAAAIAGIVASIAALGLAGIDAIAKWNAYIWTTAQDLEAAHGTLQPALIALVVACVAAALFSGAAWSYATMQRLAYDEMDKDDEMIENDEQSANGGESWA